MTKVGVGGEKMRGYEIKGIYFYLEENRPPPHQRLKEEIMPSIKH